MQKLIRTTRLGQNLLVLIKKKRVHNLEKVVYQMMDSSAKKVLAGTIPPLQLIKEYLGRSLELLTVSIVLLYCFSYIYLAR